MDYYLIQEFNNRKRSSKNNNHHLDMTCDLKLFKDYPLLYKEPKNSVQHEELDDSFHIAFRPIATLVQFLFIMPVCNITSSNSDDLVFKWNSFRVVATLMYLCYGILVDGLFFKQIYTAGINLGSSIGLLFFSYTATCIIIFLNLAVKWPKIMKMWKKIDNKFTKSPYKAHNWKLSTKLGVTAIIVISLAVLEHFLFIANCAYNEYANVKLKEIEVEEPIAYFMKNQFGFIYAYLPFSLPLAFFNEAMNMTFTFAWNYMELFVMLISLALSTRFEQINQRIKKFRGRIISEKVWIEVHEDYAGLCELVEKIDHDFRYLILLSNLNNLCFICFQLFNIFEKLPYMINTIYFWCSFLYLFGRTLTTQFLAANIHESSKYPVVIIKSIPPDGWCIEMQRMLDEARSQTTALSGMKFFYLTRNTILVMLTTIVTYELVLWQVTNAKLSLRTNQIKDVLGSEIFEE